MASETYTNDLIHETSPYLLQHAHNPVNWHAWKPETLAKAVKEDKPILVSIGYSTCHWCHVMERESFEDPSIASLMNELFINIKVDREERPDIDMIYMEAVQILTGSGGWPLNCFLLPDGRPFYGGTYFPSDEWYGRATWRQVLVNIARAYQQQRETVIEQATKLTLSIKGNEKRFISEINSNVLSPEKESDISKLFYKIEEQFDKIDGGFGGAPKFPQTKTIDFLMSIFYAFGNKPALSHALLSIKKMVRGGIYDQIGGGFARYSTDSAWLVPHFEKMLYDNALLIKSMADLFRLTKDQEVGRAIHETMNFIQSEMMHPEGGFYSAIDADSEGIEGKFYVWQKTEIDKLLGDDAPLFCEIYNVTEAGNWEHSNILNLSESLENYCKIRDLDIPNTLETIKKCKKILLNFRNQRIRPGLDDKILLAWNALTISAYSEAGMALQHKPYIEIAIEQQQKVKSFFQNSDGSLMHSFKNGNASICGMLDDYAFYIESLLILFQATQAEKYLIEAKNYIDYTIEGFYDKNDGLFYYTSDQQTDIILRKKELFDNATPSGNAVMCRCLLISGTIFDENKYTEMAIRMLKAVDKSVSLYPSSFGYWAKNKLLLQMGLEEIVVDGKDQDTLVEEINTIYSSGRIIMKTNLESTNWPMLLNKEKSEQSLIYLCKDFNCYKPVSSIKELCELLKNQS